VIGNSKRNECKRNQGGWRNNVTTHNEANNLSRQEQDKETVTPGKSQE
jgi:hypothetical protein